jgi:SsrA-binding protein
MRISNRRATFDYYLLDKYEAGIALTGGEVKSVKAGQIKLEESFIRLLPEGAFLVNAHISPYKYAHGHDYQPQRTRKLLLHRREILKLAKKMETGNLTLVPVSCYLKKNRVKLEIALARGKKKWDKREATKRRDLDREAAREVKN